MPKMEKKPKRDNVRCQDVHYWLIKRACFLNKLSIEMIKKHEIICIEDLTVKNMLRNNKLAKSISDVSWSSCL